MIVRKLGSTITATGLSRLLDNAVSHDQITRFLSGADYTSRDLWALVKAAGVLRVDVAVGGELGGFDIRLFGDILADLDQVDAAAAPALAGFGLVDMDDARQVGRQRLPAGPDARLARGSWGGFLASRSSSASMAAWSATTVSSNRSLPLGGQRLALLAEADAPVVGQFEGEGLDFEFGGVQGRVAQRDGLPGQRQFGVEPVEFLRGQNRPARQGGKGVRQCQSGQQIHVGIIPWKTPLNPHECWILACFLAPVSKPGTLWRQCRQTLPVHPRRQPLPLFGGQGKQGFARRL